MSPALPFFFFSLPISPFALSHSQLLLEKGPIRDPRSTMNALAASLHQLTASTATWARNLLHKMIVATAATLVWQHTAKFAAALARKSRGAASKLVSALLFRRLLHIRAQVFPIRVIDVEETLGSGHGSVVFRKPTSWEFHTISHTWSKGVQSWSELIARKMQEQSTTMGLEASYNDLFGREDFSSHPCYGPFKEFLMLLRADGVKQVWLDALCINQGSETGEKSQELQNMGSYYAKSMGCYVCAHGFGEGFETWKEQESQLVLPRWFNRVWTFQEMLIPKTVTFVLDIHPVIRRTINWSISKQGVNGPCKCAMDVHPFPQPRYLESEGQEEDDDEDQICSSDHVDKHKDVKKRGIEIICGDKACSQCGGAALIRRAKDHRLLPVTVDLYFIDRQCIVRLMIMAKEQLERFVWKKCDEYAEWKLLRLETLMQQRDAEEEELNLQGGRDHAQWDPIQVVVEISKRDCTHDEDRVLSILGLLGVEGAMQLRAGKTLDAQLLHLAQQLTHVSPTDLVKLCIAQFAGHTTPGMSWAPSLGMQGGLRPTGEEAPTATWQELHRDKHIHARQVQVEEGSESGLLQLGRVMRHFVRNVEVKNVLDNGPLRLCQARVLWDCCFVRVHENQFNLQLKREHQTLKEFQFQAFFSPSSCLLHHRVFVAGHITLSSQSMVRLEGTELSARLQYFQVCLVLLGALNLPNYEKHEVMMVCVGNKLDGLHKVGLAWLLGLEEVFSKSDPPFMCTVGGFADYMDRFVFKLDHHH
eukprot:c23927_g1_i1 orf=54-2327(-)